MNGGATIRVGADLAHVQQVADSVARFGDRYLRRVYTEHEIASCHGQPAVVAAGLAARFSAKEATVKVLRPGPYQLDWRSIEVQRHAEGWCGISLSGRAAELAAQEGIADIAVSLSHEGDMAAAVVVALCQEPPTSTDETPVQPDGPVAPWRR